MSHQHSSSTATMAHHTRAALTGPDTVKTTLTPERPVRVRENDEYAAFARRVLRAYARRVATATSRPSP